MKNLVLIMIVAILSQSCASMFSGKTYVADISATKPGSEIYIDGKLEGTDKASVVIRRKLEPTIEVKNNGETEDLTLYRSIKWGSQVANLLNWIYFIPTGTIIDAATGAIFQPDHKHVKEVTKVNNKKFDIVIDNNINSTSVGSN